MKTLENHVLLYDQDCPICQAYSGGFIKAGMLKDDCRQNWSTRSETMNQLIDIDKSRNEIALVNTENGNVLYGAESLVKIIGHSFPIFTFCWKFKWIREIVNGFYHFVSYNRHIVIPRPVGTHTCVPDFHIYWRLLFIGLMSLFTSYALSSYFSNIDFYPLKHQSLWAELLIIIAHFSIQLILLRGENVQIKADYIGNNALVSFVGAVVLCFINLFIDNQIAKILLFLIVAGMMLFEHKRRVELLKLSQSLTISWLAFRVLLGLVILMFAI